MLAGTAFACLGLVCFSVLTLTLYHHPLYAFETENIEWLRAWLWMTVLDYYGAALPLCAVIMANEQSPLVGTLWSLGCLVGGSPFCCAWTVTRLRSVDAPYPPYRYP